jgi:hypothetical protein
MVTRFAFLFLPLIASAQVPPAEVDQTLRARATEFFQDFVDGQYRKAFDLVAEQTKDEFFASSKVEIKKFQIDDIQYNDDFSKATVNLTVNRIWRYQTVAIPVDAKMPTTWKIENGKWVWYHEIKPGTLVTPMGPSDVELVTRKADGTVTGVPENITPETIAAAAQKILQQSGVDKDRVTLTLSKASSYIVTFHNGAQGSVSLELSVPKIPGFSAKLDKTDVNLGENATLRVQYEPSPDQDKDLTLAPATLVLMVAPFNQQFLVQVNFSAAVSN